MNARILPRHLSGQIMIPPSKSQAHRLLMAAALATGPGKVSHVDLSDDIKATLRALTTLGCACRLLPEAGQNTVTVVVDKPIVTRAPAQPPATLPFFDCGESGSSLRFLIPLAMNLAGGGVFTGSPRLMERPQEPYLALFRERNIAFDLSDARLTVKGSLPAGRYRLRGDVSSQFVTGLLYALALLPESSHIDLSSPLESRGYVDMSLDVLAECGVVVEESPPLRAGDGPSFSLRGAVPFAPREAVVEGDWSQSGFFYTARGLGHAIEILGLNPASRQGDRIMAELAERLDGPGEVVIDVSQCPDLVPALALRAALRDGASTHIINAARLRIKESDRLDAVTRELTALGANIAQAPDSLSIHGLASLRAATVSAHNDHRIAMMLAIAASRADGPVLLSGADSVRKSYPGFWDDYTRLGGVVELHAANDMRKP